MRREGGDGGGRSLRGTAATRSIERVRMTFSPRTRRSDWCRAVRRIRFVRNCLSGSAMREERCGDVPSGGLGSGDGGRAMVLRRFDGDHGRDAIERSIVLAKRFVEIQNVVEIQGFEEKKTSRDASPLSSASRTAISSARGGRRLRRLLSPRTPRASLRAQKRFYERAIRRSSRGRVEIALALLVTRNFYF